MGGEQSAFQKSVLNQTVMNETAELCSCDRERRPKPDMPKGNRSKGSQYVMVDYSKRKGFQNHKAEEFYNDSQSTFLEKRSYKVQKSKFTLQVITGKYPFTRPIWRVA
jgi:hypothetical protein